MGNNKFADKDILEDIAFSQKAITDGYNCLINRCENLQLRTTLLNILREEHNIYNEVYEKIKTQGSSNSVSADKDKINSIYTEFKNIEHGL